VCLVFILNLYVKNWHAQTDLFLKFYYNNNIDNNSSCKSSCIHWPIEDRWKEIDGLNELTKQVRSCTNNNVETHADLCILDSLYVILPYCHM